MANPYDGGGAQNAAKALGAIGRELSRAGKMGEDVALQLQAAKNAAVERERMNEIEVAFAEHEASNMGIRDPEERLKRFETFTSETQAKLFDGDYMPPVVRRSLEANWSNLVAKKRSRALTQAGQLMVERTRAAYGVAMDKAETIEEWNALGEDAHAKHMMTGPELEDYKMKGFKKFQSQDIEVARGDDPFGLMTRLESGEFKLNKLERQKEIQLTERAVNLKRREIFDNIFDRMHSVEPMDPKDIDELGKQLRPQSRMILKNALRDLNDDKRKELIRTPEYQAKIAGKVALAVQDYDPNGKTPDIEYAQIRTLIGQMSPSYLRDEYIKQLDATRNGKEQEINDAKKWGLKQISDFYKASIEKIEKPKSIKYSYLDFLDDGLLYIGNLKHIGFKEGDAEYISGATDVNTPYDEKINRLQERWNKRDKSVPMTEFERKVFGGLASGASLSTIAHEKEDPESRMAYEDKLSEIEIAHGKDLQEYADWIKTNANKSYEEIRENVINMGIGAKARSSGNGWRRERPTRGVPSVSSTYSDTRGFYRVSNKTRDQITGFSSKPGNRMVSLDFNDQGGDSNTARGIEIKVPADATPEELNAARAWVRELHAFYKSHGLNVPIRHGDGIKHGGRGVPGVFHTEPFFAANEQARKVIEKDPEGYAEILGRTLGNIDGVTFIPPHKLNDPGAAGNGFNERDFAKKHIIPYL